MFHRVNRLSNVHYHQYPFSVGPPNVNPCRLTRVLYRITSINVSSEHYNNKTPPSLDSDSILVDSKTTAPAVYSIIILTIYKYIDLLSLYVTLLPPLQRKQCYDVNVYQSIHHVTVF
jgi:hypothetical protein